MADMSDTFKQRVKDVGPLCGHCGEQYDTRLEDKRTHKEGCPRVQPTARG